MDIDLNATLDGAGSATNLSGLEFTATNELALLQGCADNQILKWNDTPGTWDCEADISGGGGVFTDATGFAYQTTVADSLVLGSATELSEVGRVQVLGNVAGEALMVLRMPSSPTADADMWILENNAGTDIASVDVEGDADFYSLVTADHTSVTGGNFFELLDNDNSNKGAGGTGTMRFIDNDATATSDDYCMMVDGSPRLCAQTGSAPSISLEGTTGLDVSGDRIYVDVNEDGAKATDGTERWVDAAQKTCITVEALAAADDDMFFHSTQVPITVRQGWCYCAAAGTCTVPATITVSDRVPGTGSTAMTNTIACRDVAAGTATVTTFSGGATAIAANHVVEWSVTGTAPDPDATDQYIICISYTED
jgi:hypothetical protein